MKKVISKNEFLPLLQDGLTIMVGGFLTNGTPETLMDLVLESGVKHLTIICNDGGYPDKGVGKLICAGRVDFLIASHIGTNPKAGELMTTGEMKVRLTPQGTLVEQIRAGGAGLGGILTRTGMKTIVEEGKQMVTVDGVDYLLEKPLHADMALLGGAIADRFGNLQYQETMRNFNPTMAFAADTVVAEVFSIVDTLDPNAIHTPHPLVDYVLVGDHHG